MVVKLSKQLHLIFTWNSNLDIGGYGGASGQDPKVVINLRIVKGTSVYTSNFTPPTSPLTNITNTKLLCCQTIRNTEFTYLQ